ncbi:MAG: response regulator [Ottowia sp.]|nr:response regulator [Ottowia sp.]
MATILVVDDEIGIRELLCEILSDEGHTVELAENAQQARNARARQTPDLVLLDIWMPDTDGVTLLKEWSASGQLTMPVIMMSGHATIDTAVEATRIGALNFLEKPISLQKLLKAVEQGLTRNLLLQRHVHSKGSILRQKIGPVPTLPTHTLTIADDPEPEVNVPLSFDLPLRDARDLFERSYFEYHLIQENGSMTKVAEKSGLERTHLYRKLKHLGVDISRGRVDENTPHTN